MCKSPMLLILVLFFSFSASTQTIKIRQSFQSADLKTEPAVATYTRPNEKPASYLIDAAIGLGFSSSSQRTISIFAEHHRNSLVDEESNSWLGGVDYEYFTNPNFGMGTIRSTTLLNATAKYSNDLIKKVQSMQLSGEVTRIYAKGMFARGAFLPNAFNQMGNQLAIEYFPSVGFEYEGRFRTEDEIDRGSVLRGMGKLNINMYLLSTWVNNQIILFGNAAYRHDLISTTGHDDHSHPSIETGIDVILMRGAGSKRVSIGGSYNNLDNPGLGKEKQEFWLVALKIKF